MNEWNGARTMEELCELTALWIESKIEGLDGSFTEEDESHPIRDDLAFINRHGLLTILSQPGWPIDRTGYGQRAAVMGFASAPVAGALETLTLHTEILVFSLPPDDHHNGYGFPATVRDHHPSMRFGRWLGDYEKENFGSECSPEAEKSVSAAWRMTLIDARWGRRRYLWDHIIDVLKNGPGRFSAEPFPRPPTPRRT